MKQLTILSLALLIIGSGCTANITSEVDPYAGLEKLNPEEIGQLYDHHVRFATSADGESWDLKEGYIAEHASVPDLMTLSADIGELEAGDLMSIFVDSEPVAYGLDEGVSYIVSKDNGETWSERIMMSVDNEEHLPVDPSIIQLEDGTLRLYYYDFRHSATPDEEKVSRFYVADSDDGVNFNVLGEVWSIEGTMTDPEVIQHDGEWLLYYARHSEDKGGIWVVRSDDGMVFSDPEYIDVFMGIPGAMSNEEQVHLFGCDRGGIVMSTSDDGRVFEPLDLSPPVDEFGPGGKVIHDGPTIIQTGGLVCDPSPAIMSNGAWGLVVKVMDGEVTPPQPQPKP